jgi:hypothetical protein
LAIASLVSTPSPCEFECSGHGQCNMLTGVCTCDSAHTGSGCQNAICPSNFGLQCSGNGTCNTNTGVCACNTGYTGSDCSLPDCSTINSGHGCGVGTCVWTAPNHVLTPGCNCPTGFTAASFCTECTTGYTGSACNLPDCSDLNNVRILSPSFPPLCMCSDLCCVGCVCVAV